MIENENILRLGAFIGVFLLMALLEAIFPRRRRVASQTRRWITNLAIIAVNTLVLRVTMPVLAVGMAHIANTNGWGLFTLLSLPLWLELLLAVAVLDLLIYFQHVATHKIPLLWALHRVHHADRDIDVTTGLRFHPIEIVLSMLYKLLCVVALGPSAAAVIVFEIALNASAMFNHANFRLPIAIDRALRWFIVTPDMHRIHHSIDRKETNNNYGFFLSVWDRIFKTYTEQPAKGHNGMTIGLPEFQSENPASLSWSLALPFMSTTKR